MKKIIFLLPFVFSAVSSFCQDKWDLRKVVDYAVANNITIKQADIQASISGLQFKQSKLGLYPNGNFTASTSFNSGRNQDPTSFALITQSYLNAGLQLQTSVDIFNWFSKRNTILANQWQYEAAKATTDKLKNDISLTVANSYLQILLAREQANISQVQLKQTQAQLANTRKLVKAGSLPELNAAELEAQEALDSANFINAHGNVVQATLVLKSNMNFDAAAPFDVEVPPVELIPVENIADLQPDAVYALAIKNLPQQRVNNFKLRSAQKTAEAARGKMYPSLIAFGGLSSNFINTKSPVYFPTGTYSSTPSQVTVGSTVYNVSTPDYSIIGKKSTPFFTQVDNNFRQQVGLSMSVPIFSGGLLKSNFQRSKLDIRLAELQQDLDNQTIKQDIYQAYNAAEVALEKFNASQKSVTASQRTLDFSQKRYEVGMLGTFELITQQNNFFRAKLQHVLNQFDYVFKMKVLEFYKGQGLKL
mgnify:CR=1 FL=1